MVKKGRALESDSRWTGWVGNILEAQTAKTEETNCASSGGGRTALKSERGHKGETERREK